MHTHYIYDHTGTRDGEEYYAVNNDGGMMNGFLNTIHYENCEHELKVQEDGE